MKALQVYSGPDGELTKRYYAALQQRGPIGHVAMNLFRAQKCSARAKVYRGGGYKGMAYERKSWSMGLLVAILKQHGAALEIPHGWKQDPDTPLGGDASWVLYVELPQGQVSFHSPTRGEGPEYAGEWDGMRKSAERIIQFCDQVYAGKSEGLASSLGGESADAESAGGVA